MQPRIDSSTYLDSAPVQALLALEKAIRSTGLEPSLLELVKIRASQINRCAYCLDMHTKEARAHGESEQRIYALNAWRETPFFTERERAALAWTEAVTRIADDGVPDATYDEASEHFQEAELVALTFAVVTINGWNRLQVAFRSVAGTYRVAA